MRASVVAEKAGVRTVSIVASGFIPQARSVAKSLGVENLPIAEYPGVIMTDSPEVFRSKVDALVDQIVEGMATPLKAVAKVKEPGPKDVVFRGTLDAVQDHFADKQWTDGMPVVPPTVERVERFLKFTDRSPDEVIGSLLPEKRQLTVWNVAVNGVMAGCRPEYMPILLSVADAIVEPEFRIEDAGSTPGWEPLIIVNGPIVKELDFNYGSGAMRMGRRANTSVGRFLRLLFTNVAGVRIPPGATDKGSFGISFNVAMAENEDACAQIGWQPFSVDRGFRRGENVVTVQSVVAVTPPMYTAGNTAREVVRTLAEVWGRGTCGYWAFTGVMFSKWCPVLALSPSIAKVIANDGWSKDDLRKFFYDTVKMPAGLMERYASEAGLTAFNLRRLVEEGSTPKEYWESDDPNREVRVFVRPEEIGIVLAGDPDRNQARGYVNNHIQGPPVSKRIELPAGWERLLKESRG